MPMNARRSLLRFPLRPRPPIMRAAVVLTITLLLVTSLGRRDVYAAPTLTASENPVRFSLAAVGHPLTKTIRLAWNLDGTPTPLELVVREQDPLSPAVQTTLVASQTGSVPLTVTSGKTYLAQLIHPRVPMAPLASLTIRTAVALPPPDLFLIERRQIEVVYEQLDVIGDSDSAGSCECSFEFYANDEGPQYHRGDYDSGMRGVRLSKRFLLTYAPETLVLCVRGYDDDHDPLDGVDTRGLAPSRCQGRDTGSDSSTDWNTARGTFDARTAGSHPFSISTPPGELRFAVHGRITVSYVR